jgi:hypothetical protein
MPAAGERHGQMLSPQIREHSPRNLKEWRPGSSRTWARISTMKMLKGFNPKEFFLNHGEKIGFGVALLLVLVALGRTEWSPYSKTPQQIISKVQQARSAIEASVWPPEKQMAFALQDYTSKANELRGPLQIGKYEFSTNMWWPLYRKQELAKEPELLAVTDLIATPGVMALGIVPKADSMLLAGADGEATATGGPGAVVTKDETFDPDFAPTVRGGGLGAGGAYDGYTPPGVGGPAGGHGAGGPPGRGMAADPAATGMRGYSDPGGAHGAAGGYGGEDMYGDGGYGSMGSAMNSRGERFVSVRGVWPLWQQMEKFQRALNLQSTSDAQTHLQLLDFVLERQTAVAGSEPWSGPWDVVDVQRAVDVLNEAFDFAIDPVDPRITDVVITMPLPARLVGQWGDYATHPRIANFVLPPQELEREMKLQEKLMEEFEKYRLQEEKKRVTPKGFSGVQRNFRAMADTMFNSEYDYASEVATEMDAWGQSDMSVRMTLPDLKARLTAVGRLLLFRYLDFDVRPGHAYRYRVKLVLRNPNFEKRPEEVVDVSVAEGQERETPYSNITNAAIVPESAHFFLRDVDRDPVYEPRSPASRPLARIDFFEWDATVGTMIKDVVDLTTYGQFVGAKKKSLQLDVAAPSFKDTEVTFHSDDLLVDALGDIKLDADLHRDLKLPGLLRGKAGAPPAALVMDEGGNLRTVDPQTNATKKQELTTYVERERKPFEKYKNQEAKPASYLDGGEYGGEYGGEMMYDGAEGYGGPPRGKSKKKNPRKLGGAAGMGMYGP